jgi:hypothetical protein
MPEHIDIENLIKDSERLVGENSIRLQELHDSMALEIKRINERRRLKFVFSIANVLISLLASILVGYAALASTGKVYGDKASIGSAIFSAILFFTISGIFDVYLSQKTKEKYTNFDTTTLLREQEKDLYARINKHLNLSLGKQ